MKKKVHIIKQPGSHNQSNKIHQKIPQIKSWQAVIIKGMKAIGAYPVGESTTMLGKSGKLTINNAN